MSTIRALPDSTISQLRSSFIIQSLPACVIELIQNSVDAHSTSIEIAFGLNAWQCRVTDNGVGIDKDGLEALGRRYHTSKAHDLNSLSAVHTYGYRGEALASIADISLVEVISKHASHRDTYSTILQGGAAVYYGPSKHVKRSIPGTVIHVRDLFYKWPVRRKQAMSSSTYSVNAAAQIRKAIEHLAVINPSVAFFLVDLEKAEDAGRTLSISRSISTTAAFGSIYGKALVREVAEVDASENGLAVIGFISLASAHSKQHQLVYVNGRPVSPCEVHQRINHLFARSSFARRLELDHRFREHETSPSKALLKTESPRKHIEHHPIFCLNLVIPYDQVDVGLEPTKRIVQFQNEDHVLGLVTNTVTAFLVKYGFAHEALASDVPKSPSPLQSPSSQKKIKERRVDKCSEIIADPSLPAGDPNNILNWRDPHTGKHFLVDRRSGFSWSAPAAGIVQETRQAISTSVERTALRKEARPDARPASASEAPTARPSWLDEALKGYTNPVFPNAQQAIKTVAAPIPSLSKKVPEESVPIHLSQQISKERLGDLVFLEQVDRKFLLCRLPTSDVESTLFLIDQHAADERIRVEGYLQTYCQQVQANEVELVVFQEAKPILLTAAEANKLKDNLENCATWGLKLEIGSTSEEIGQVYVQSVPAVVADRLGTDMKLVQQLLKRYLVQLSENGAPRMTGEKLWTSITRHCPQLLIELINSKACRGAIMFNDLLDRDRCKRLLLQLNETDFPFVCAHGRPSMVPLVRLAKQVLVTRRRQISWKPLLAVEILDRQAGLHSA